MLFVLLVLVRHGLLSCLFFSSFLSCLSILYCLSSLSYLLVQLVQLSCLSFLSRYPAGPLAAVPLVLFVHFFRLTAVLILSYADGSRLHLGSSHDQRSRHPDRHLRLPHHLPNPRLCWPASPGLPHVPRQREFRDEHDTRISEREGCSGHQQWMLCESPCRMEVRWDC